MMQEKTHPYVELHVGVIIMRRPCLVLLIMLLGYLTGCVGSIPVLADNRQVGVALKESEGYFVPMDAVASLTSSTYTLEGNGTIISFSDGFQQYYPIEGKSFKKAGAKLYVHSRLLGTLFGLVAESRLGKLEFRPVVPDVEVEISDSVIRLKGTTALAITASWGENGFTIETPVGGCNLASQEYSLGTGGVFTSVKLERGPNLRIVFLGTLEQSYSPVVRYGHARNTVDITWARVLGGLQLNNTPGRPSLYLPLESHQKVEVIGTPEIAFPRVTLRQRSHLYIGPGSFFSPLVENLPAGTEGQMTGYVPGFVKVRVRNSEGWFHERNVSLDARTPGFPINIRDKPATDARIVGVLNPGSHLILRERVQGGYAVWAPDMGISGFLLDGQNLFEQYNQHHRDGLSTTLRFFVSQALPYKDVVALSAPFTMLDAVAYRNGILFTVCVNRPMHMGLRWNESGLVVEAGAEIQGIEILRVPSGEMLSLVADGAYSMEVRRVQQGLEVTVSNAVLGPSCVLSKKGEVIKGLQVMPAASGVGLLVELESTLSYRLIDWERLVVMTQGIKGKTVVVDPGHGGEDPGALGRLGWHEKDYTLDIALRLASVLEKLGAHPILTHRGVANDTKVHSDTRIAVINSEQTDAFISIHLNAFISTNTRGAETYYFSGEENVRLARLIQQSVARAGMRDRQIVNSQTLAILRRGQPPGVLAEVGFITNPEDEKMLFDPNRRQQLAESMAEGLRRFFMGEGK